MLTGRFIVQNINWNDRPGLRGSVKSGLIFQTEVAAEPDNLGFTHTLRNTAVAALVPRPMNDPNRDALHLPVEIARLPERGFAIDRYRAFAVAALFWILWGVLAWLVLNGRTDGFDNWGLLLYRNGSDLGPIGGARIEEAVRDMTALGGVFLGTLAAIGAVVALLFLRMRREAALFALTVLIGWQINNAMKWLVGRARPDLVPQLTEAHGHSFPSGHSFSSAMIYVGMALAFAALSNRESVRYTVVGAAMLLSLMIAWSRVMLGVHFPSDVAAGWLGGTGWAFLASAVLYRPAEAAAESDAARKLEPSFRMRNRPPER